MKSLKEIVETCCLEYKKKLYIFNRDSIDELIEDAQNDERNDDISLCCFYICWLEKINREKLG